MSPRRTLAAAAALVLGLSGLHASAGPVDPVNGPFPQAHGEMIPSVPTSASCTTKVVKDAVFKNSAYGPDGAYAGTYTPTCKGPWSKVVVTLDAYVEPGTQFDRIGELQIGGVQLLHFTTPEGTSGRTTWSIDRDVTDDAALFTSQQSVWFQIGNVTDGTYTGIFHGAVTLTFWAVDAKNPAAAHADVLVPLGSVPAKARNLDYVNAPVERLTRSAVLPRNLTTLRAEVFTSGHGGSEEDWWYGPLLGNGLPYREVAVYVDGRLAGIAPVFPALFTGGWGPDWWRPIPGPRTLNLRPYTMDLTPFVGLLTDGKPHAFGVGILGWKVHQKGNYWPTALNLLGTVNHKSSGRTRGGLSSYTAATEPSVTPMPTDDPVGTSCHCVVAHTLNATGWTQVPGGQRVETKVVTTVDATLNTVGAAVKSDWHWVSTATTGGIASGIDATYQLVRDGARFAFVDKYRTNVGATWQQVDDRMQTHGPTMVSGVYGASQEWWQYSDSSNVCVTNSLVATMQNALRDSIVQVCDLPDLPVI